MYKKRFFVAAAVVAAGLTIEYNDTAKNIAWKALKGMANASDTHKAQKYLSAANLDRN